MMLFFKLVRESFIFAFQSIIVNKVRTLLSLLGITIGIFSVISVLTIFDSMEIAIRKNIEQIGDNVLFIQKWPWSMGGEYPWWKYFKRPEPTISDMNEIKKRSQAAQATALMINIERTVEYKNNRIEDVAITAVSHDFANALPLDLSEGRYFTQLESKSGRNVAIIGSTISEKLFSDVQTIGKQIKIFGGKLDVIGIM